MCSICQLKMENFFASVGVAARAKLVRNWRQAKAKFLAPKHTFVASLTLRLQAKKPSSIRLYALQVLLAGLQIPNHPVRTF